MSYETSGLWVTNIGWAAFNLGKPGYARMSNGMTIQWGNVSGSTSGTDYKYFPVAFNTGTVVGVSSYGIFGASGTGSAFEVIDRFKFLATHRNDASIPVGGLVNWIAVGI